MEDFSDSVAMLDNLIWDQWDDFILLDKTDIDKV